VNRKLTASLGVKERVGGERIVGVNRKLTASLGGGGSKKEWEEGLIGLHLIINHVSYWPRLLRVRSWTHPVEKLY